MKKVILITGASRGLGRVMLEELSKNKNYKVYGTSRNKDSQDLLELDVRSELSVKKCIDLLMKKEERIDIIINNVGSNLIGSLEATDMDCFKEKMDLNFYGALRVIHKVMPVFRDQGQGRIINISSVGGLIALPYNSTYAASKAALEAATESLFYELISSPIHVSLIEPLALELGQEKPRLGYISREKHWHKASQSIYKYMLTEVKPNDSRQAVAKLVERIIESDKPKLRYSVSLIGAILLMNKRLMPFGLFSRMVYKALGPIDNDSQ